MLHAVQHQSDIMPSLGWKMEQPPMSRLGGGGLDLDERNPVGKVSYPQISITQGVILSSDMEDRCMYMEFTGDHGYILQKRIQGKGGLSNRL